MARLPGLGNVFRIGMALMLCLALAGSVLPAASGVNTVNAADTVEAPVDSQDQNVSSDIDIADTESTPSEDGVADSPDGTGEAPSDEDGTGEVPSDEDGTGEVPSDEDGTGEVPSDEDGTEEVPTEDEGTPDDVEEDSPEIGVTNFTGTTITTVSIEEGSIAHDGTFTIAATTYQNHSAANPIEVGSTTTISFPDNIVVPDGTYEVLNTWFDQFDLVTGVVTVSDNVATITITQGMLDFVESHSNYPEYYLYPKIPGAQFVDQASLGGTWQTAEFTTDAGGPFSDSVYIQPGPPPATDAVVGYVRITESSIAQDGTFTTDAWIDHNAPVVAGSTSTITFPPNVVVADGTYEIYDIWFNSPDTVVATVTVVDNVATVTVEQGMVDVMGTWPEYWLYPEIPGGQFVDQASLGGTWQTAEFTTSNGGPFSDSVYILPGPAAPSVVQVYIQESIIPIDGTFTTSATTYHQRGVTAGTSYTIDFPDNIIVPDGEYPVYDVWWDTSVVAATVTVVDGVATVTVEQGMVDLLNQYNWPEYYLYPSIPGSSFVDQETLGGTWQTGEFTTSNGGPFSDSVYILDGPVEPDPTTPSVVNVHILESVIPVDGDFTILATTYQQSPVTAGTSYTIEFPDNIIVPDGEYPVYDVWWDTSVVAATVTVVDGVATVTIEQGMVDLLTQYNWPEYYLYPSIPGATFVNQETLGGTWQSATFTSSNGGPFADSVYILPANMEPDPTQPVTESMSIDKSVIPVDGDFTLSTTVNYPAPVETGGTHTTYFPDNIIVPDGEYEITENIDGVDVVVATVRVEGNVATVTTEAGMQAYLLASGESSYSLDLEFPGVTFVDQETLGGTQQTLTVDTSNGGSYAFAVTILPEDLTDPDPDPTDPDPTDPTPTPDPTDPTPTPDPTDPTPTPDPTDPDPTDPDPTDPDPTNPDDPNNPDDPSDSDGSSDADDKDPVTGLPTTGAGNGSNGLSGTAVVAAATLASVVAAAGGLMTVRKKL